jgi:hypothetical protein
MISLFLCGAIGKGIGSFRRRTANGIRQSIPRKKKGPDAMRMLRCTSGSLARIIFARAML